MLPFSAEGLSWKPSGRLCRFFSGKEKCHSLALDSETGKTLIKDKKRANYFDSK
jgi:hypothetical protein